MIECDVLVVGGGPAGSTVSKYLSMQGVKTLQIQRNFDFKKPCGGGLRLDAFDEFGLDKKYVTQTVDKVELAYKDKNVVLDIRTMPLAIVERRAFDTYLREESQKQGTEVLEAIFISCEVGSDFVISTIKHNNETKKVKSNYIIAADGVNSKIRKLINNDETSALMTSYTDIKVDSNDMCSFYFGKEVAGKYYAWSFPEEHGVDVGTLGEDTSFMKNLKKYLKYEDNTKDFGYKIPHYTKSLFYKSRVFFVGDSAGQVLPFTYEGIYYAMSSAKILASVISENEDPSMYETRWNKKYLGKFETMKKLQKIFLANNFMISIMMKLYTRPRIQEQMIELWLGKRTIEINMKFFFKVIKKVFKG